MILGTLFWQMGISVYLSKPLVSSICLQLRFFLDMGTRILEQLEIVFLSLGNANAMISPV